MIEVAKEYLSYGLNVLPCSKSKKPSIEEWKSLQTNKIVLNGQFDNCWGIGIFCGAISDNLECIDIDCKYDLTGKLYGNYKKLINEFDKNILKKLVVEQSPTGGYHFLYRCKKIEGNRKLAKRYPTEDEKKENEKSKDLIETRGEGGYFVCSPSEGYKLIYGSFGKINEITPEERQILFDCAYTFNSYIEKVEQIKKPTKKLIATYTSPFDDWNDRGDALPILTAAGWTVARTAGKNVLLKRPGTTASKWSASYDIEKRLFYVFSTSTEFESETGYNNTGVLVKINFKNDYTTAAHWLLDNGYGEKNSVKKTDYTSKATVQLINNDFDFVATTADAEDYLRMVRDGTFQMGLSTGFEGLDEYFRFKPNSIVVINGVDNTGKSLVAWYFSIITAIFHKWKWILFCPENKLGAIYRKLLEFYLCMPLAKASEKQYADAKRFVDEHVSILKNKAAYTYSDLLLMSEKLLERKKFDSVLIDPYNSVWRQKDKTETVHDYDYEVLGNMRLWIEKYSCSIYINCHAATEALRKKYGKEHQKYAGMILPPGKADTEGGGKFANRCDDFLTVHRHNEHPDEKIWTEIYVRKIKEEETGGTQTPFEKPFRMKLQWGCGFEDEHGFNPIKKFWNPNQIPITYNNSIISDSRHPDKFTAPTKDIFDEEKKLPF